MRKLLIVLLLLLVCGVANGQVLKQVDGSKSGPSLSTVNTLIAAEALLRANADLLALLKAAYPESALAYWTRTIDQVDSTKVKAGSISLADLASYIQTKINNAIQKTVLYPKRFLLPTYADTTVAAQNNNNVTVQAISVSTAHPDSGSYVKFISEDGDATIDTVTVAALQDVISPFDSLIVFVKSNAADQKAVVKITGATGLVVLNQTITTTTTDCWVRYAFPVAATVIEQDYTVLVTGIVDSQYYIMVSRVTAKKV